MSGIRLITHPSIQVSGLIKKLLHNKEQLEPTPKNEKLLANSNKHHQTTEGMSSTSTTTTTALKQPNLAITTDPSHELSIVEVPIPSPAAGECLIHVTATGICGSDVHFWKHGGIGSSKITCELGLGHESAGEIVGLGEGVEEWKVGKFLFFVFDKISSLTCFGSLR